MKIGFEEIKTLLPQRFPFLMLDRILALERGKRAVGVKNITGNEIFFVGHFPEKAVLPGVLIIESMAQLALVLFRKTYSSEAATQEDTTTLYFLGSTTARFLKPVFPGDQLLVEVTLVKAISSRAIVKGTARVDEDVVAEADLGFGVRNIKEL